MNKVQEVQFTMKWLAAIAALLERGYAPACMPYTPGGNFSAGAKNEYNYRTELRILWGKTLSTGHAAFVTLNFYSDGQVTCIAESCIGSDAMHESGEAMKVVEQALK